MKRTIWIFSLAMLLFSTFTPSLTYATGEVEIQAQEILSNTLVDSMNIFENTHWAANLQQSQEDINLLWNQNEENNENSENDEIQIIWNNNHILWNKTKWIITVYTWDYSYGITLQDKNLWATKYLWEEWATDWDCQRINKFSWRIYQ